MEKFDLVIHGGCIVDGSGKPPFEGDLALSGDQILKVSQKGTLQGKRRIDARGKIVAPGFVDIHSHSDYFLLVNPIAEAHLVQGVTTEIGGNCGYSAAPIWGEAAEQRRKDYQDLVEEDVSQWRTLKSYFDTLERRQIGINYGHLIGHNTLRHSISGVVERRLEDDEKREICLAVREALAEGAFGLSTGLIYSPGCFADTAELAAIGREAALAGAPFAFHMRSEGNQLVEAVEETLEIGRKTGGRVQISHLKTSGPKNWPKIDEVFERIEKGLREGQKVGVDRYPYIASQTVLSVVLPQWTYTGGREAMKARLKDPGQRKKIFEELASLHPLDGDYWSRIKLMAFKNLQNKVFEGVTLTEGARTTGKNPIEFMLDLLIDEETDIPSIFFTMSEENLRRILSKPYVSVASDSGCRARRGPLSEGSLHPRAFGTFPRVIKKYVLEEKILTLEEAIYKMTLQPCEQMNIPRRGVLREGYFADIVVFDLDRIEDCATFEDPKQYPSGIDFVLVNGQIAVENGELTGVRNGKVLKR
ncbi:MAG: D-aminoacylase [Deltaproteobacteria bacterium]|nr:D-aminoacylase [Deltaproteobacteria bacterium]